MKVRKALLVLLIFLSVCATPGVAQIFWSNQSPTGVTDDIWCVTYANGTFAAVTNQGNLLTSTDGLNWRSQAIDSGVWLVSIANGNGLWVVVGDKGTILVSSDLKNWVSATSGTTNRLNGVLYNGIEFVVVGESGTILTSRDAQSWVTQPSGFSGFLHGITCDPVSNFTMISGQNGALFVFYPSSGTILSVGAAVSQNIEAVLYEASNPTGTVIVGANGTIGYDPDGPPIYDRETLVLFGASWASVSVPGTSATFRGLTHGNGAWVAAGDQGTIVTSTDGIDWTQRFSGDSPSMVSTATLLSASYSEPLQRFVVTGTGGTILVSNAAPTVFGNVSTRGFVSNTQTFIGGFVIEGTAPRTVLIRADGPVLNTFGVPSALPDPVLTVYDNTGTAIATNTGWATNTNPATISTAALEVGAFALPNPSPDSALLLTLQPGAYTAQITSAKGNSGTVLFEAYTN